MSITSKISRCLISTMLVLTLSALTLADTIRLKDGSIIKGKIVSFASGKFTVVIGDGSRRKEMLFAASEIQSIQFDAPGGPPQLTTSANRNATYKGPAAAARKPDPPQRVLTKSDPGVPSSVAAKTPVEKMKPIEWSVNVTADSTNNGWTNSGWVVKKGQRIRVIGEGSVSLGRGQTSTPSGIATLNDDQKLLKNVATGALVAVIGDDNNDFIYVGAEREFTATRDGALFLGINEGNLADNSGSFKVRVEIRAEDVN